MQSGSLYLNSAEEGVISALLSNDVRFVVIGGAAVQYHGHLRERKDLDLLVEPSDSNAEALASALSQLGFQLSSEEVSRLSRPTLQMPLSGVYSNIEILTSIKGVDFLDAFEEAIQNNGIRILSKQHLIASKRHRGEQGDMDDIKALESA